MPMSALMSPAGVAPKDTSQSAIRALRFNLLLALFIWTVWLFLGGLNALHHLLIDWKVALTMVFGSMVGGGTSEGGGAIAFPIFTKLLHIAPSDARNFSLAIQSVGMGAASLSILYLRVPIRRSSFLRVAGRDDRCRPRIVRGYRRCVHPLFGAFLAGLCFPRIPSWQQMLRSRLELILSLILLPMFFALTGLKTRLDLLNDPATWLWTGFILLLAATGKIGGAVIGARMTGQDWRFSLALGALLNTRGLVELIVLNIAYNAHVFSPTLFTMLVVMALVTTAVTVPILNYLKIFSIAAAERPPGGASSSISI